MQQETKAPSSAFPPIVFTGFRSSVVNLRLGLTPNPAPEAAPDKTGNIELSTTQKTIKEN